MENFEKKFILAGDGINKKNIEDEDGIDRRKFLIKSGGALAIAGTALAGRKPLGKITGKVIKEFIDYFTNNIENEINREKAADEAIKKYVPPTPEQAIIEEEDAISISEIVNYNKEGNIELTLNTTEAIKNHWKNRYQKEFRLKNSLKQAFYEIGAWEKDLRAIFKAEGVPEKYIYLAIPESHWKLRARSNKRANGPYQFIPETARKMGMNTGKYKDEVWFIDERYDPIVSGRACARLLKQLHEVTGDWRLALSGYNGGYLWRYLRKHKNDISYENFLVYMGDKLNEVKNKIKKSYLSYKIKPGDGLRKIAVKYRVNIDELCRLNNIVDPSKINAGEILKIPISEKEKEKKFLERVSDFKQNLNYPAKMEAVLELIEQGEVKNQKETIKYKTVKVANEKKYSTHIFTSKDKSIYNLSKKLGINYKQIMEANQGVNPKTLREGVKLIIPGNKYKVNLKYFTTRYGVPLKRLEELNPAIKNINSALPDDYEVRI